MICPECNREFTEIGKHFSKSSCSYPKISQYEYDIMSGLLMGDGSIDRYSSKNPSLVVSMTTKKYLEYIFEKLGVYSSSIRLSQTAEEAMESSQFENATDISNYSDIYRYSTISSPHLGEFEDWYDDVKKFPEDINLTPTVLVHWFVCDGTYDTSGTQDRISIAMSNERKNKNKIESYFRSGPGISEFLWNESERGDGYTCNLFFTSENSDKLFDYMEMSDDYCPPGFEYKFPE